MVENGNGSAPWPEDGVATRAPVTTRSEALPKRVLASAGFVLDATRRRRAGRIALWALVVALAVGGVGMLVYPFVTDVWAGRIQNRLETEFTQQLAAPERYRQATFREGSAVTRLRIPRLKVDVIVVEGWSGNALRAGAGHRPGSPLPGDPVGNVPIAGHRTGFGEPFRHLDKLRSGDKIELATPVGTFVYEVVPPFDGHGNPWVVAPDTFSVIGGTPYGALTLITCDPPHTSKNRLIVRARLVGKA